MLTSGDVIFDAQASLTDHNVQAKGSYMHPHVYLFQYTFSIWKVGCSLVTSPIVGANENSSKNIPPITDYES